MSNIEIAKQSTDDDQILESSITEYNNDLHASNMAGMPILARTGGSDGNVPPYHTRKYVRLVDEHSHDIGAVRYVRQNKRGSLIIFVV